MAKAKRATNWMHIHNKNDEVNRKCHINQEHDNSNSIEDPVLEPASGAEMA
jgi:hypothetical protein